MQFVPEAADLLAAIGKLLDEKVLNAVPPDLQHQVRVAAHLSTLLEREARLGPSNAVREHDLLHAGLAEADLNVHLLSLRIGGFCGIAGVRVAAVLVNAGDQLERRQSLVIAVGEVFAVAADRDWSHDYDAGWSARG